MNYKFEEPVTGDIGQEKYQCSITWRNGKLVFIASRQDRRKS
jgi:putative redox protein